MHGTILKTPFCPPFALLATSFYKLYLQICFLYSNKPCAAPAPVQFTVWTSIVVSSSQGDAFTMAKVTQGCFNMFTKVTPGIETETGSKLRPGIALPHAALPTTGKCLQVLLAPSHPNPAIFLSLAPLHNIFDYL